jgi:hypothetical protein
MDLTESRKAQEIGADGESPWPQPESSEEATVVAIAKQGFLLPLSFGDGAYEDPLSTMGRSRPTWG